MSSVRGISLEDLDWIVKQIQSFFPDAHIIAFGSRVYGKPRLYSDVDICIQDKAPLNLSKWSQLDEVFENSELKFIIDLSDYHLLTSEMQQLVTSSGLQLV